MQRQGDLAKVSIAWMACGCVESVYIRLPKKRLSGSVRVRVFGGKDPIASALYKIGLATLYRHG